MYLIFFDESKNDNDYQSYHIGAVTIEDKYLLEIEAKVSAIAEDVFGNSNLKHGTEFHAAEIYHRKRISRHGMISKRESMYYED